MNLDDEIHIYVFPGEKDITDRRTGALCLQNFIIFSRENIELDRKDISRNLFFFLGGVSPVCVLKRISLIRLSKLILKGGLGEL